MLDQFNVLAVKSLTNTQAENMTPSAGEANCVQFLTRNPEEIISLFRTLIFTVMFEHHQNMWVY